MVVSSSSGALLLKGAYTYAQREDAALSAVSAFTFASDPLTVNRAVVSGSLLTVAGSGFQPGATLAIDLLPTDCTVSTSLSLTATLTGVASGEHCVTVTNPDGHAYTLTLAFELPSGNRERKQAEAGRERRAGRIRNSAFVGHLYRARFVVFGNTDF